MWSKELRDYTLEHFSEGGSTFLKSQKPCLYAVGYNKDALPEEFLNKMVPKSYREYPIVLLNRDGMGFLRAYRSLKAMVDDGWAID